MSNRMAPQHVAASPFPSVNWGRSIQKRHEIDKSNQAGFNSVVRPSTCMPHFAFPDMLIIWLQITRMHGGPEQG